MRDGSRAGPRFQPKSIDIRIYVHFLSVCPAILILKAIRVAKQVYVVVRQAVLGITPFWRVHAEITNCKSINSAQNMNF